MIRTPIVNPVRAPIKANEKRPIFSLSVCGDTLVDEISGQVIQGTIAGSRYGIRNNKLVTYAANKPSIDDIGFRAFPNFTQLAPKTELLSDSSWIKTNVTMTAGTSFQGCAMWNMKETTTNGAHSLTINTFTGVVDASYLIASFVLKAIGRKATIRFIDKANATTTATFDLATYSVESSTLTSAKIIHLGDGYCRILAMQLAGTGATTPSTTLLVNSSGSTSYAGNTSMGLIVGQPLYVNCGTNGGFWPPYTPNPNTSGLAIVNECGSSTTNGMFFDLDVPSLEELRKSVRGVTCEGSLEYDFISGFDTSWIKNQTTDLNILSIGTGGYNLSDIRKFATGITQPLSINTVSGGASLPTMNFTYGTLYRTKISWGMRGTERKQQLTINSTKGGFFNGNGIFGSLDLRFFQNNSLPSGWIVPNTLKFYATPSWVI